MKTQARKEVGEKKSHARPSTAVVFDSTLGVALEVIPVLIAIIISIIVIILPGSGSG
jgi:hypothetical protein